MSVVVTNWAELGSADFAEWDELARRSGALPDMWSAWARSLVRAHRVPPGEIVVFKLLDDSSLRAIWPVRIRSMRRIGLTKIVVEPLLSIYSLHHEILSDVEPDRLVCELLSGLDSYCPKWTVLNLTRLVHEGRLANAWLKVAHELGFATQSRFGSRPPYLEIDRSWDEFIAGRPRKFRSNLAREARNIAKAGDFSIAMYHSEPEVRNALPMVEAVEAASWKARKGTSLTTRAWEAEFYSSVAIEYARAGMAMLSVLTLGGRPLAYDLMLHANGRALSLKSSFDDEFRKLSPGSVLEGEILRWVFSQPLREFDFLGTDESYKLQWSQSVRQDVSLTFANRRNLHGQLIAAGQALAGLGRVSDRASTRERTGSSR